MMSIWKLIYELEWWIQIQTADDIVRCPDNRPEYQHLVQDLKSKNVDAELIPARVLVALKREAELPFYRQPTFWHLVRLVLNRQMNRLKFWSRG